MTPHLESGRIHLVTTKPESGAESEDPRTLAEQRILAIKESARSATTEAQLDALYAGILKEVQDFKEKEESNKREAVAAKFEIGVTVKIKSSNRYSQHIGDVGRISKKPHTTDDGEEVFVRVRSCEHSFPLSDLEIVS